MARTVPLMRADGPGARRCTATGHAPIRGMAGRGSQLWRSAGEICLAREDAAISEATLVDRAVFTVDPGGRTR
jgi:hypothetical protein